MEAYATVNVLILKLASESAFMFILIKERDFFHTPHGVIWYEGVLLKDSPNV